MIFISMAQRGELHSEFYIAECSAYTAMSRFFARPDAEHYRRRAMRHRHQISLFISLGALGTNFGVISASSVSLTPLL